VQPLEQRDEEWKGKREFLGSISLEHSEEEGTTQTGKTRKRLVTYPNGYNLLMVKPHTGSTYFSLQRIAQHSLLVEAYGCLDG
jgi:hypothetical protein